MESELSKRLQEVMVDRDDDDGGCDGDDGDCGVCGGDGTSCQGRLYSWQRVQMIVMILIM